MKQLLLICALLIAFTSCVDTPKPQTAIQQPDEENPPMLVAFGTVGDGTSMHSLELINQKGDTLYFVYENNAVGGLACFITMLIQVLPMLKKMEKDEEKGSEG